MISTRNLEFFVELHDGITVGKATGFSLDELRAKLKSLGIKGGAVFSLNGQNVKLVLT